MIAGFEEITYELTNDEKQLAERLAYVLSSRVGVKNAITSEQIIKGFKSHYNVTLKSPRVRKMINYIRVNFLVKNLVANSRGYYIENDAEKIDKYIESLLQRAVAIKEVANSFKLNIEPQYATASKN